MKIRVLAVCAVAGAVTVSHAADRSSRYDPKRADYPALTVKVEGRSHALRLARLEADVTVAGGAASTELTMVFANEADRDLEGEFIFPLAKDATISRFAMDVNGALRDGVVVEKDRARDIFESIVARKVDPGLLEWVDGTRYRARIFPIPANETKTIALRDLAIASIEGKNFQRGIDLLTELLAGSWEWRDMDVALVGINDLQAVLARPPKGLDTNRIDKPLLERTPSDLRVVLTWDSSAGGVELAVNDPANCVAGQGPHGDAHRWPDHEHGRRTRIRPGRVSLPPGAPGDVCVEGAVEPVAPRETVSRPGQRLPPHHEKLRLEGCRDEAHHPPDPPRRRTRTSRRRAV